MSNLELKQTEIGGRSIVLKTVPASKARQIQTTLLAVIAEPLAEALGRESTKAADKSQQMLIGLKGIAGLLPSLKQGALDEIISQCKPFILVNGKPFNEDEQFDANSLMDMYEVLWFFLKETFGGFIDAVRLRFPQIATVAASSK